MKTKPWLLLTVITPLVLPAQARAESRGNDFYKGKTIRFVVGLAPGGGYDLSARTVARHLGKHIAGNPTIVVENMTGAGSTRAANYTYNSAKPDGLFVGIWNSALILRQALGDKAMMFDGRKFGWIGAPTKGTPHCSVMGHTGFKSLKDVLATSREIKMGSTGPGSTYDDTPRVLNRTIGTKFKIVSGYEGTGPILVAMRRKEIDGGCWGWESARTTARSLLDAKGDDRLIPFIIHRRQSDPEVKDLPIIPELIKGDDNLSAYRTWVGTFEFQRPFMLPPGAPKERLETLRKGFFATMKDPEFIAEAKKSKLEITYVSGEQVDQYVDQVLSITPRARELLDFLSSKPKK
jgi:tripartite-type tricarboxylate transporter receptor subunit TctC